MAHIVVDLVPGRTAGHASKVGEYN